MTAVDQHGELNNESFDSVGSRIRSARELAGMTSKGLAKKIENLSIRDIKDLEKGRKAAPYETLKNIANELNVESYWINVGKVRNPQMKNGSPHPIEARKAELAKLCEQEGLMKVAKAADIEVEELKGLIHINPTRYVDRQFMQQIQSYFAEQSTVND